MNSPASDRSNGGNVVSRVATALSWCVCAWGLCASVAVANAPAESLAQPDAFERQLQGRWEVIRTLVPNTVNRHKANVAIDDVSSLGRVYDFQREQITYKDVEIFCTIDPASVVRGVPVAALFDKGSAAKPLPSWVRSRLRDSASNYALGSLTKRIATLYRYDCPKENDDPVQGRVNVVGNWLAIAGDTILLPFTDDGLRILKRPARGKVAGQTAFCATARTANDRAICEDAEMWRMYTQVDWLSRCALSIAPALKPEIQALVDRRQQCEGDRDCVYAALDEQIGLASTKWSTPVRCDKSGNAR